MHMNNRKSKKIFRHFKLNFLNCVCYRHAKNMKSSKSQKYSSITRNFYFRVEFSQLEGTDAPYLHSNCVGLQRRRWLPHVHSITSKKCRVEQDGQLPKPSFVSIGVRVHLASSNQRASNHVTNGLSRFAAGIQHRKRRGSKPSANKLLGTRVNRPHEVVCEVLNPV